MHPRGAGIAAPAFLPRKESRPRAPSQPLRGASRPCANLWVCTLWCPDPRWTADPELKPARADVPQQVVSWGPALQSAAEQGGGQPAAGRLQCLGRLAWGKQGCVSLASTKVRGRSPAVSRGLWVQATGLRRPVLTLDPGKCLETVFDPYRPPARQNWVPPLPTPRSTESLRALGLSCPLGLQEGGDWGLPCLNRPWPGSHPDPESLSRALPFRPPSRTTGAALFLPVRPRALALQGPGGLTLGPMGARGPPWSWLHS